MFWRDGILHHGSSRAGAMNLNNHHDRISTRDEVACVEHGVESCTDAMVIVQKRSPFRVQADDDHYGLLADHCFRQLGIVSSPQPYRRGYIIRLCIVGVWRDLYDNGDVQSVQGSDSNLQRPTAIGSCAPWPVAVQLG